MATFFKVELTPVPADKIMEVAYKRFPTSERVLEQIKAGLTTLEDRIGDGVCPDCGESEWMLLALTPSIKEGGKSYIECTHCGHITHL